MLSPVENPKYDPSRRKFIRNMILVTSAAALAITAPDQLPLSSPSSKTKVLSIADRIAETESQMANGNMTFEQASASARVLTDLFDQSFPAFGISPDDLRKRIFMIDTPDIGTAQRKAEIRRIYEEAKKNNTDSIFSRFALLQPAKDLQSRYPDENFSPNELEAASINYLQPAPYWIAGEENLAGEKRLFVTLAHLDIDTPHIPRMAHFDGLPTGNNATTAQKFRTDMLENFLRMSLPEESCLETDTKDALSKYFIQEQARLLLSPHRKSYDLESDGTKRGLHWVINYRDASGSIEEKEGDFDIQIFVEAHLIQQANRALGLPYALHYEGTARPLTYKDHENFGIVLSKSNIGFQDLAGMMQSSNIRDFYLKIAKGANPGATDEEKLKAAVNMLYTSRINPPDGMYIFPKWDSFSPYFPQIQLDSLNQF